MRQTFPAFEPFHQPCEGLALDDLLHLGQHQRDRVILLELVTQALDDGSLYHLVVNRRQMIEQQPTHIFLGNVAFSILSPGLDFELIVSVSHA